MKECIPFDKTEVLYNNIHYKSIVQYVDNEFHSHITSTTTTGTSDNYYYDTRIYKNRKYSNNTSVPQI